MVMGRESGHFRTVFAARLGCKIIEASEFEYKNAFSVLSEKSVSTDQSRYASSSFFLASFSDFLGDTNAAVNIKNPTDACSGYFIRLLQVSYICSSSNYLP